MRLFPRLINKQKDDGRYNEDDKVGVEVPKETYKYSHLIDTYDYDDIMLLCDKIGELSPCATFEIDTGSSGVDLCFIVNRINMPQLYEYNYQFIVMSKSLETKASECTHERCDPAERFLMFELDGDGKLRHVHPSLHGDVEFTTFITFVTNILQENAARKHAARTSTVRNELRKMEEYNNSNRTHD